MFITPMLEIEPLNIKLNLKKKTKKNKIKRKRRPSRFYLLIIKVFWQAYSNFLSKTESQWTV